MGDVSALDWSEMCGVALTLRKQIKPENDRYILTDRELTVLVCAALEYSNRLAHEAGARLKAQQQEKTMRTLTDHIANPVNDRLKINVLDEPGSGGANHLYEVKGFDASTNDAWDGTNQHVMQIMFQNGPITPGKAPNGLTQEVLLAIVLDRLTAFQRGPFANGFNATALVHCQAALDALKARTAERIERGVEGTLTA